MNYTLARDSHHIGVFSEGEIREGLPTGRFLATDLAWREGMPNWETLALVLRLPATAIPSGPVPPPLVFRHPPPPREIGDDAGMRLLLPVGRSGWAIAAGYLGLFALLVLPAPLALIVSLIAIRDIKQSKSKGKQKFGMGRAVFGLIMGVLGTVMIFVIFARVVYVR